MTQSLYKEMIGLLAFLGGAALNQVYFEATVKVHHRFFVVYSISINFWFLLHFINSCKSS